MYRYTLKGGGRGGPLRVVFVLMTLLLDTVI